MLRAADEAAVAAGTTVTVSTGDAGITNTIGSPASDPAVISVGATTTYRFDLQTGYAAARFPGITGWLDDNISSLSSGGFTGDASTLNLVAPGELNYAVCSTDLDMYEDCADYAGNAIGVEASGGTSESAPIVAGVAALVIQAYRRATTATRRPRRRSRTSWPAPPTTSRPPATSRAPDCVNAYKAVLLAGAFGRNGTPADVDASVLSSSHTQLHAVTKPGTTSTFTDTVTNHGTSAQRVHLSSRTLQPYRQISARTLTLSDSSSPKYTDFQGLPDNYAKTTFAVPATADRLSASIAYQAASSSLSARDRLTLVDPNGNLAAYSLPQGIGNYGHVEVAKPAAGRWTAYLAGERERRHHRGGRVRGRKVADVPTFGSVTPAAPQPGPGCVADRVGPGEPSPGSTPATPPGRWSSRRHRHGRGRPGGGCAGRPGRQPLGHDRARWWCAR